MKKNLLIFAIVIVTFASNASARTEADILAARADSLYRHAEYDEAIMLYNQVLEFGYASDKLYYNLGNAYYRTSQLSQSILNYKRALRLNPHFSDAKQNLNFVQSQTVDRITTLPEFFLKRWANSIVIALSPMGWRVVWLLCLAILSAVVVLFLLSTTTTRRRWFFASSILMAVVLVLATVVLISSVHRFNTHSEAVVTSPTMAVKSSPEQQSVDKIILHEGTLLTIDDSLSSWYKIRIADGSTGWCQSENIERI